MNMNPDEVYNRSVRPFVAESKRNRVEEKSWLSLANALNVADLDAHTRAIDVDAEVGASLFIDKLFSLLQNPITDMEREILQLRFHDDLTIEEVATQMNLPVSKLRYREQKILSRIRDASLLMKSQEK
jgi:DNA-directed RNA polymerase specialized sigma subunit